MARIEAAIEAARDLGDDFVLTARCENYLRGNPDLADTIERLQAYEAAGADVLYAPGPRDIDTISTVCDSLSKPVNVVMGLGPGAGFTVEQLSDAGVKRITLGSALARAALGIFVRAADEVRDRGTFTFADDAISFAEIEAYFPQMKDKT